MKFCTKCGHKLIISGALVALMFHCTECNLDYVGTPIDTLLVDEELTKGDSVVQSVVLVENSPHDPAARWVRRTCPKCNIPRMALNILDEGSRIIYACKCGHMEDGSNA